MKHIFLFVIFTLLSIIITSEMVNAQNIKFIEKGLSILPMGEKLNDSVKLDLKSISTSTLKEKMEHSLVFGLQDSLYYENISGNEKYLIDEKNFKNMYVGYTKDEIVKKIFIKFNEKDFYKIKETLDNIYGIPNIEVKSNIGDNSHKNYLWSSQGFDIVFLGLGGILKFYYPKKKWEEYLKVNY